MSKIGENLSILIENYFNAVIECVEAIYVFDRDGLLIAKKTLFEENSEQETKIYGAIAGVVEPTLKRITSEYPGSFGTGSFETEDHRLVFTEAGPLSILLSVFQYDAVLQYVMPYSFLVSEKIANILDQRYDNISLTVPNLELGYELSISPSKIMKSPVKFDADKKPKKQEMAFKLCVLGDPAVGKTTLINKFVTNKFYSDYKPTLGISITSQVYSLQGFEENKMNFMIWDLAGQKFFRRVRKHYYQAANASFIIFDITRRDTFEGRIKFWFDDIRSVIPDIPIVIVGNKHDLITERQVSREEGKEIAKKLNCSYLETSAKSGQNVRDAFSLIGIGLFFKIDKL